MKKLVDQTLDALDLDWGGIDIFPTKDGLKICEVNPNANIVSAEAAHFRNISGMMIDQTLDRYRSSR
jgi:glutathione synthase/RimK-type ligase-like ATP-grasp enzyme